MKLNTIHLIIIIINFSLLYLYINKKKRNQSNINLNNINLSNLSNNLIKMSKISTSTNINNANNNNANINNAKYLLNNNITNVYTKNTIPEHLNTMLLYITKLIISKLININFNLHDFEKIYEQIDDNNNKRYVIIFFVYNVNDYNSNKLLLDFIINVDNNYIYINNIQEFENSYANIINNYDNKIIDFKSDNKNYYYTYGYLNNNTPEEDLIKILNKDYKNNYNYNYLDTELGYSNINFKISDKKYLNEYSKKYLPNPNIKKQHLFCNKNLNNNWNKKGILKKNKNNNNKDCIFQNTTSTLINPEPNKYPSFILNNTHNSSYSWLIDPLRKNIREPGYNI